MLEPSLFPLLHKEAVEAGMEILTYQGEAIAATQWSSSRFTASTSSPFCWLGRGKREISVLNDYVSVPEKIAVLFRGEDIDFAAPVG